MITMLVLALVGVASEDIADDYELSAGAHPMRRRSRQALRVPGRPRARSSLRTLAELDLAPFAELRAALCARLLERTSAG